MNKWLRRITVATLPLALALTGTLAAHASGLTVTRATLANGLKIVVIHDPLAPVVTTILNYKVGSNEQTIPGQAHALEHMMFRGSKTLSSSQLMDSIDVTGGSFDADTQDAVTQYYFTVPSQYLDIALRLERSRATGLSLAEDQWKQERGAITQEVTQDNSSAIQRLLTKMQDRILKGTPYANNTLGTVKDFATKVNSSQLRALYNAWYHPNNAVYVVAGDVNGPATVAQIKALFGNVHSAKLPARRPVHLQPLKGTIFRDTSSLPFTAVLIGHRVPGYDSKYYAASVILGDVLSSQRGNLYALTAAGKTYFTGYFPQEYRKTGIGTLFAVVPISTKPEQAANWVRAVIAGYRKNGVPANLVDAAKLREISQLDQNAASIEGLAFQWSQAIAVQGISSPDAMRSAFSKVTVAEVNHVLRQSFTDSTSVTAYAVPKNGGKMSAGGAGPQPENVSVPPTKHVPLPSFALAVLHNLKVPTQTLAPTDTMLSNGVRLIVQPEHVAKYVVVSGQVLNNPQVQDPVGQSGINSLTTQLMPYGTTTYDRLAFQAQLDKIAATTSAGTSFSLQTPSNSFDRGVQLLADEELHPAFDAKDFAIVKAQSVKAVADQLNSPDYLTQVALADALYPLGDPERRMATVKGVSALTLDNVKAWYNSAYRPDLTTIVVVGDVSADQAKAAVEKYFGAWSASGAKPNVYPPAAPPNVSKTVTIPATGRVQSSVQLVETTGLLRSNPEWANFEVANTALTGGFYSSLLYHDLREIHGYAYSVGSRLAAGKVRSTYAVTYACDPQNIIPAQQQVIAVLNGLQAHGLSADRLLKAKALLMGEVPIREAAYDGMAGTLLDYAILGLPLNQATIDAQRELAATSAMVKSAVNAYMRPADFVRIVTGPGPK